MLSPRLRELWITLQAKGTNRSSSEEQLFKELDALKDLEGLERFVITDASSRKSYRLEGPTGSKHCRTCTC
jgi:hypothetical protein